MRIRKILVPTDFSDGAREAATWAAEFARGLGATLTVLHVYHVPAYTFPDGSTFIAGPQMATQILDSTRAGLASLERELAAHGVTVDGRAEYGVAWKEICRVASEGDYDLVVIGTRGHGALERVLVGSVAEKVVRHCERPVLTIHASRRGVEHEARPLER